MSATILLYRGRDGWIADYRLWTERALELRYLFGSPAIPLPWTREASFEDVETDLASREPAAKIYRSQDTAP